MHALRHDVATTIVLILLAVLLEAIVGHTRFAHHLALASYHMFQEELASQSTPISIIDISDLRPKRLDQATSRPQLQELLLAIATHNPKAIGIDIDFSPEKGTYLDPADPSFFDFCTNFPNATGIPLSLGVGRATGGSSADWLGDAKYQQLAASIVVPHDTQRMPYAITDPSGARLRSISASLAAAYGEAKSRPITGWLERMHLISRFSERRDAAGLAFDEYLVDYSALDSLFTVRTASPELVRDQAFDRPFRNHIVLIGDVEGATDLFPVPGRERLEPGVKLHGCAVHTLVAGPLYGVTHVGGVVLTATLIIAVLAPVVAVRAWSRARGKKPWILERLHGTITVLLTLAALVCSGIIVRTTHVIWDGFFLAFFALAFHQPVEDLVHAAGKVLARVGDSLKSEN
jgi:CHASE2 domain-containing sensor protein